MRSGSVGMQLYHMDSENTSRVRLVKDGARDPGGATFCSALHPRFRHRYLALTFRARPPDTLCSSNNPRTPRYTHHDDILGLHQRACLAGHRLLDRHWRPRRDHHRHALLPADCCGATHLGLWPAVAVRDVELGIHKQHRGAIRRACILPAPGHGETMGEPKVPCTSPSLAPNEQHTC